MPFPRERYDRIQGRVVEMVEAHGGPLPMVEVIAALKAEQGEPREVSSTVILETRLSGRIERDFDFNLYPNGAVYDYFPMEN